MESPEFKHLGLFFIYFYKVLIYIVHIIVVLISIVQTKGKMNIMIGYDEDACLNCKHDGKPSDEEPCKGCIQNNEDNWEPK